MGIASRAAGVFVLAALATEASAQLYKCTRPDGKIVYSDTRCEAAASGSALKVVPNSSTDVPQAPPADGKGAAAKPAGKESEPAQKQPEGKVPEASTSASAGAPARYELTSSDRERLRSLGMTVSSSGATSEQKEAAQLETRSIRSGRESGLSRDDRELRESLTVDLGSVDRKKRNEALRQIRDIYYR